MVDAAADILLRMAVTLQVHLMQRLNTPNTGQRVRRTRTTVAGPRGSQYTIYPNPSRPGEYLHKRTGWAQAHVVYEPTTPSEVAQKGYVRVGWGKSAFYGAVWERKPPAQARKGLLAALDEIRPQLMQMARR
jgi:hypothetical protein